MFIVVVLFRISYPNLKNNLKIKTLTVGGKQKIIVLVKSTCCIQYQDNYSLNLRSHSEKYLFKCYLNT